MKNYSYVVFVIASGLLLSLSTAIFADVTTTNTVKSYSAKSSLSNRSLSEPAITNEAEYADFVKRNEKAGQASSAKSAPIKASMYSTRSSSRVVKNQ